ncbi:SNF1 protein kinase subunit beta-2 OS=Saccharomyces cerevisiae (strain ATCC 204508 / S288c) GN=SIP2 PE=1 SV=3 [Rhizoctonia solani AG-1 IB]|uniref:SNF1 protein kinase subunit beta-2 n=1 Tax=Thanatephorus cucumeris (strain AG1-IB / isolate 7/3/14) TaxID=1108050 RepID=A0A0B7G0G4_THACB|nr:SNF1 protein kinase subunit beta-2 OS=Saccharomyces cerevisiae (strain ATCC 204508 / S288c) GN=SIP2 PE=1 SV=3 [Rhizoctonia solani AG-1 IB]
MGQTASHPPVHTLDPRARSRGPSPAPPTARDPSPLPPSSTLPPPRKPTHGPRKRSLELPDLTTKLTLTPHVRSPPQQATSIPIPIRGQQTDRDRDRDRDRERIHRFNNTNDSLLDVQAMNDVLPAPHHAPHHPSPSHRRGGYHAPPSSLVARASAAPGTPPTLSSPPKRRSPKKTGEHIYSTIPLGVSKGKARADPPAPPAATLIPTRIAWPHDGIRVQVAGTFDRDWQGRRTLAWDSTSRTHVTTLDLRPGTHRLKFIVDDQWKCSDDLPTAVDDAGNLVNYIEVAETDGLLGWEKGLTSAPDHLPPWTSEIPPLLVQAARMEEEYLAQRGQPDAPSPPLIPHPPALPRHLEKVILNARTTGNASAASGIGKPTVASMGGVGPAGGADDNSVLPVPNHVVLNHLGTSAIKGGVLAVGTTTRYHRKYITTIYYKPVS